MTSRDDVYANVSEFAPVVDVGKLENFSKKTKNKTKNKEKHKDKEKNKNKKNVNGVSVTNREPQDIVSGGLSIGVDASPLTNGDDRNAAATFEKHRHNRPSSLVVTQSRQPDVDDGVDAASSCGIYEELPSSPSRQGEAVSREFLATIFTKTAGNNRKRFGGTGKPETISASDDLDNEPVCLTVINRATSEHSSNASVDKSIQQLSRPVDEYASVNRLPVGTADCVGRTKLIDAVIEVAALDIGSKTPLSSASSSSADINGIEVAAATTPTSGFVDESIYSNCGEDVLGSRFSLALASSTSDEASLRSRNFGEAVTSSVGEGKSRHVEAVNVVVKQPTGDAAGKHIVLNMSQCICRCGFL